MPVDGPTGLAFVRSRHLELLNLDTQEWQDADEIPDLGRIGRQQAFLREVGTRRWTPSSSDPFKGNEIADSAVKNLTLDQDFGRTDVFALADGLAGKHERHRRPREPDDPDRAEDAGRPGGARRERATPTRSSSACATSRSPSPTPTTSRPRTSASRC